MANNIKKTNSSISWIQDGEEVTASVTNRPTKQINQNYEDLYDAVNKVLEDTGSEIRIRDGVKVDGSFTINGNLTVAGKIITGTTITSNFKNRIINGDFQVWQRGEDVTISKQGGYIGTDRFFTRQIGKDSNGNITYAVCDVENKKEHITGIPTSSYYISNVDTSLTNTSFEIIHRVEPLNYWDLVGKKITISFWIKTNKDIFNLYIHHNYIDSNGNEVGETIYSEDISIQPDVWTKIERTVTLSSANYITIDKEVFTELFAVKIYDIADNDYIRLLQVQVEEGNVATEFEYVPYDVQLIRCLRYYEIVTGHFSAPVPNGGWYRINIEYKTPKRTIPTIAPLTSIQLWDNSNDGWFNPDTSQLHSSTIYSLTWHVESSKAYSLIGTGNSPYGFEQLAFKIDAEI